MSAQPFRPSVTSPPPQSPPTQRDRPYPEIPPGQLALRARHWANTIRDLGGVADEVTVVLSRNPWLWAPIWFAGCLFVVACWTTVTPELLAARFGAPAPALVETAVSTFWGRLSVTFALSVPVVSAFRLVRWVASTKRAG